MLLLAVSEIAVATTHSQHGTKTAEASKP